VLLRLVTAFVHSTDRKQSQKVAHAVPEIAHSDSGVQSIDSLSSEASHIPSYADQQLAKEQHDAEDAAAEVKKTAHHASKQAQDFGAKAEDDLQRLEEQVGKKYQEWSKEAKDNYQKAKGEAKERYGELKKEAGIEGEKAKKGAKEAEEWADKNKGNPVVVGNVVVLGALAALLGTGAYRMNKAGTLTWQVAGAWAGVVGLFAVGDYYVSQ